MRQFDEQEAKIIKELIKDPRASDNSIAKKTKVPVMTVNRKRKRLEEKNLINYFTAIRSGEEGTGLFHARQMYILKFKIGLTRKTFLEKISKDRQLIEFNAQYIVSSYLGEKEGHLALMMIMEAETESDLVERFNGKIVPMMKKNFGEDSLINIETTKIIAPIRLHHNYLPLVNMESGKIKKDWNDDNIFVDKKSFPAAENNKL